MPELPEVESARRALLAWLPGTIDEVVVVDPAAIRSKLSTLPSARLPRGEGVVRRLFRGARTERLLRHGKRLGWVLDRGAVLVHLGMTGRFVRRPREASLSASVRIAWLAGADAVWFEDSRRFGCVVPCAPYALDDALRSGHGPDAFTEPLTPTRLRARLGGKRPIKDALMDQTVIAGLGNIHAAEALFRARIHPMLPAGSLTGPMGKRLARAITEQLAAFVAVPGPDLGYVNLGGPNPFQVYRREGEPCPECDAPITRLATARSTYFCAVCQPVRDRA